MATTDTQNPTTPEALVDRWRDMADVLMDEADGLRPHSSEGEKRVAARQRGKALGLRKAADELNALLRTS